MEPGTASRGLLTTKEVADYRRLKERKIYDLVREAECDLAVE
jgi:hypothetical protein